MNLSEFISITRDKTFCFKIQLRALLNIQRNLLVKSDLKPASESNAYKNVCIYLIQKQWLLRGHSKVVQYTFVKDDETFHIRNIIMLTNMT